MKKWEEKVINALECEDFAIHHNDNLWDFAKFSSKGQEFSFKVIASTKEELSEKILEYYVEFDPDYEASLWMKDGHGVNGAPYSAKEVIEDMEECKQYIYEAYEIVEGKHRSEREIIDEFLSEDNDNSYENIIKVFSDELNSNEEPWDKKGYQLLKAVINNDIDGIFMALCGWSFTTILERAEKLKSETEDENDE